MQLNLELNEMCSPGENSNSTNSSYLKLQGKGDMNDIGK